MPSLPKKIIVLLATVTALVGLTAAVASAHPAGRSDTTKAGTMSSTMPSTTVRSAKKGGALWYQRGIKASIKDSGISWYYDWDTSPNGVKSPKGVPFVPMIFGAQSVTKAKLKQAQKHGNTLLGFNEPDITSQSNMTVKQALKLWPRLEKTHMRLGSPAVTWAADQDGQWLDRFMMGAKKRGYRVDFITLHWYGSDFNSRRAVNQLKAYVQATHKKYHKPIWVTEYSLSNFDGSPTFPSPSNQAEFATKSTAVLEKLPYVERYAWFSFPTSQNGQDETGLYRPGGAITEPGKAYRAAG